MNEYRKIFREIQGYKLFPSFEKKDSEKAIKLIEKYSWAVPNKKAIKEICKFGAIIEIGAGGGYWASLIKKAGGNIIAYDNLSTHQLKNTKYWFKVKYGSFEKIKQHKNRILFLCFPPCKSNMAFDCLNNYTGEYFLYIGEELEGCKGNESFFNEIFENWNLIKTIDIPSYGGVFDSLFIYKRKVK